MMELVVGRASMSARVLLLALLALVSARACSPLSGLDAMDVASARRVLGVQGVASAEQTRAAFHRAALQAHPDKPGGSHDEFVTVVEAYEVLRNGVDVESGGNARSDYGSDHGSDYGIHRGTPSASAYYDRFGGTRSGSHEKSNNNRDASRHGAFDAYQASRDAWGSRDGDARGYLWYTNGHENGYASPHRTNAYKDERYGGDTNQKWWDGGGRVKKTRKHFARDSRGDARTGYGDYNEQAPGGSIPGDVDDLLFQDQTDRSSGHRWWNSRGDAAGDGESDHLHAGFGPGAYGGFGTRGLSRMRKQSVKNTPSHAFRDDLESMEEYVWRRAWAESRGMGGHDRVLEPPGGERENFAAHSDGESDDGWDDARARASQGEEGQEPEEGHEPVDSHAFEHNAYPNHLCAAGVLDYC